MATTRSAGPPLVLMAFAQVIPRVRLLQYRKDRLEHGAAARHFAASAAELPAARQVH